MAVSRDTPASRARADTFILPFLRRGTRPSAAISRCWIFSAFLLSGRPSSGDRDTPAPGRILAAVTRYQCGTLHGCASGPCSFPSRTRALNSDTRHRPHRGDFGDIQQVVLVVGDGDLRHRSTGDARDNLLTVPQPLPTAVAPPRSGLVDQMRVFRLFPRLLMRNPVVGPPTQHDDPVAVYYLAASADHQLH